MTLATPDLVKPRSGSRSRRSSGLALCLAVLSGPVPAQEAASRSAPVAPVAPVELVEPVEPVEFVSRPGDRELRGVLCARPLQPSDAAERGLSPGEVAQRARAARAALANEAIERHVRATDEYLVVVPPGVSEASLASRLLATGNFQYVEPDWLVFPLACPSDPQLSQQWHHDAGHLRSCDAWGLETGDPSVVVAVCDSGLLTTHEDLQLHRREGLHVPTMTWESAGGPIDDVNGHGTLCVGVAAANGDNGVGVAGVGWNLGHRMLRVTDASNGSAPLSTLTEAARAAADVGDRVVSVSYSSAASATVGTAGTYVRNRNALLVWAAGNDGVALSGVRDDDVIVVGATDPSDALASFSNFGSIVDLVAPGVSIHTTSSSGNSHYGAVSGTSFACPMTAGLCALIWSRNPLLTPQQVEGILRNACDDLGAAGVDDRFGYGRINAHEALALTPQPPVLISFPNGQPAEIVSAGGSTLLVAVVPWGTSAVTTAARFWVDTGVGFVAAPITYLGADRYAATFPSASCPSDVDYYFEFPLFGGGVVSSPEGAPANTFATVAANTAILLADPLEAATAWTVGAPGDTATTGQWIRVDPVGTAAQPEDDHTLVGTQCFVTGQGAAGGAVGAADVDGGATTLLSPALDLTTSTDPHIGYWRWFSNDEGAAPSTDVFVVSVSNDGGVSWATVETVGPTGPEASGGWFRHTFRVASIVTPTANVRLRFVAADLGAGSAVEAAIDDLEVFELCGGGCGGVATYCVAAANSTGAPAAMGSSGSASFAANDLVVGASGCPGSSVGVFVMSPDQASTPLGNGNLCLGTTTLGLIVSLGVRPVDPFGAAFLVFDNTAPPSPQGQVAPGATWNFQFVYRDVGAGGARFNLTNGLRVTFCP